MLKCCKFICVNLFVFPRRVWFGLASDPSSFSDPPTFLEPMKDQVFHLRHNGRLECRVHGIPYPTVQFKKDWRIVADSHRVKIIREEYDHWGLNVMNAIRLDEGVYECVAENVAGKVYCTANVKVTGRLELHTHTQIFIQYYYCTNLL